MPGDLSHGIYAVSEAVELTGISAPRIRRWFRGYETGTPSKRHRMPPVITGGSRELDGQLQLSFLDLIEIRLIEQFLQYGVPWRELRRAASVGTELLGSKHPFTSLKFRTDGRRMFADIAESGSDGHLLQLRDRQQVFRSVVEPALVGVEFDAKQAVRWWPLGERKSVVIDPVRAFGKPIVHQSGVPVRILTMHAQSHGVEETSSWYCVTAKEVKDALAFSRSIAA